MEQLAEGILYANSHAAIKDMAAEELDIYNAVMKLNPTERLVLNAATIGFYLVDAAAERIERGREIGDYGERARLTVMESGIVFKEITGGAWPKTRARETRYLETGEVIEGNVDSMRTTPDAGGKLRIHERRGFFSETLGMQITGLVAPESGDPQVELEILARQPS